MVRIFIALAFSLSLHAAPFTLQPTMQDEQANQALMIYEDPTQLETIETIKKKNFSTRLESRTNIGTSRSNFWVKLPLSNPSSEVIKWHLKFFHEQYDHLESWYYEDNILLFHEAKGDHESNASSDSYHERSTFSFLTPARTTATLYILLSYDEGGHFELFHSIFTPKAYEEHKIRTTFILSAFFTGILILLFYNLFVLIVLKSKEYLYYIIYLVSVLYLMLSFSGIGTHYLWSSSHWMSNNGTILSSGFVYISFILFTRSYLAIPKHSPKLNTFTLLVITLLLAGMITAIAADRVIGIRMMLPLTFTVLVFPFIGWYFWRNGHLFARGYTLASSVMIITVFVPLIRFAGLIETSEWSFWIGRMGFIIEGVFLAFALADRIAIFQRERDQAQATVQQTLLQEKEHLEIEVEKRTKELQIAKKKAENLAREDELTGLLNRRAFLEKSDFLIKEAKRYNNALSLIAIDIDFFKLINDTYGHEAGDKVLQAFSQAILKRTRETDVVARIGGEEFVVVLPHTPLHSAAEMAEILRESIHSITVTHEGQIIQMTASFGVSELSTKCENLSTLLGDADKALYQAKEAGRNRVEITTLH